LAGGVAAVTNAVINAKHQSAEEEELKRHIKEMEKIAKNKKMLSIAGSGLKKKKVMSSLQKKTGYSLKTKKRRNRTTK
jgi:hypothetical protein